MYPEKFIPDENVFAYGEVRNPGSSLCFDTLGKDEKGRIDLGVFFCQGGASANQVFSLSKTYELRREDLCCTGHRTAGSPVIMEPCWGKSSQKWNHTKNNAIVHAETGMCIDVTDVKNNEVARLNPCNDNKPGQKWEFKFYPDM